jgi:hypothetical protein
MGVSSNARSMACRLDHAEPGVSYVRHHSEARPTRECRVPARCALEHAAPRGSVLDRRVVERAGSARRVGTVRFWRARAECDAVSGMRVL